MHMGYPVTEDVLALSLGVPMQGQTLFLVRDALARLTPPGEVLVARTVAELDCILAQISDAKRRLPTSAVDTIRLRGPEELDALEDLYEYWVYRLADLLACGPNPLTRRRGAVGPIAMIES